MTDTGPVPLHERVVMDGLTLDAFLKNYSFVSIIRGPWASGKSVACISKMYDIANWQTPNRDGVRKTRWGIVRNSYPDLQETTIKTWLEIFPEEKYGPLRRSRPFGHHFRVKGPPEIVRSPNGVVRSNPTATDMENIFLALDDDEDRKKLLSMELTGGWVNEGREISKPIIDDLIGRTGRFPPKSDGGHSWSGLIMDTNAPSEMHWIPMMMGESQIPDTMSEDERAALIRPKDWAYYVQPGALVPVKDQAGKVVDFAPNPRAENIRNLTDGFDYYMRRKGGKTRSWVMINFCNELGQLVAGKPVWPTFERGKHVAPRPIPYDPNFPLLSGVDSTGRNPAGVYAQLIRGHWRIIGELIGRDTNTPTFAKAVKAKAAQMIAPAGQSYQQATITFYRDPHQEKGQGDDRNTDQMYMQEGIRLIPAPGQNAIKTRRETVENLFDNDKILISPTCTSLIAACSGGYRFRKLKLTGMEAYDDEPDKNNGHADIADALQYVVLGGGAGREMVRGSERPKPVNVARAINPMERGKKVAAAGGRASLFARR